MWFIFRIEQGTHFDGIREFVQNILSRPIEFSQFPLFDPGFQNFKLFDQKKCLVLIVLVLSFVLTNFPVSSCDFFDLKLRLKSSSKSHFSVIFVY